MPHGYSVVVRDITERLKAERRIEHLATKDALTGLSNRSMLMQQMQAAIARAARASVKCPACGGMNLPMVAMVGVNEELGRTATPYTLPPDSPNLRMMMVAADERQREAYLSLAARMPNARVIDGTQPLDLVVAGQGDPACLYRACLTHAARLPHAKGPFQKKRSFALDQGVVG